MPRRRIDAERGCGADRPQALLVPWARRDRPEALRACPSVTFHARDADRHQPAAPRRRRLERLPLAVLASSDAEGATAAGA